MYSCIIIDDQQYAIDALTNYVGSAQELSLVTSYTDSTRALKEIAALQANVDVIFMDVDMPKISGIELADSVRHKTNKLVFTTGHSKYAYEAFKVDADAFLLKPYSLAQFLSTVSKLFPHETSNLNKEIPKDFFFVKSKEVKHPIVKIDLSSIIAIESQLNYVIIHQIDKKVTSYIGLSEVAVMVKNHQDFIQLQRSYIINRRYIHSIIGVQVTMVNGVVFNVGKHYLQQFYSFLDENLLSKTSKKN